MMAEIASESQAATPAELPPLNDANLRKSWDTFLQLHPGTTLAVNMKSAKPSV